MSLVLPVFYHWSPPGCRFGIDRKGLLCTTPTAGRFDRSFKAVCLGTSPSHAWSLSADVFGSEGELWDCWQVTLAPDDGDQPGDAVHPLPFYGNRLEEVRVGQFDPTGAFVACRDARSVTCRCHSDRSVYGGLVDCPACGHRSYDPGVGCERRRCGWAPPEDTTDFRADE